MKKLLLFLIALFSITCANAQSYMGYIPDNFGGIQGVLFNPASIVDSRLKTDINLFSTSSSLNNDYYGLSLFDLSKSSYDAGKEGKRTPSKNNGGIVYSDVMGPSFMFNIAPKHALAIYTRARAVVNANDINGELYDKFKDGLDDASDFANLQVGNPNAVGHSWGEVGISYAAVILQNKQHFLKGGITAKYLVGGVNSYVKGDNVTASFDQTGDSSTSRLYTTGTLTVGSAPDFITSDEDFKFNPDSKGYGADFGLIYEWRPDYEAYDLDKATPLDNDFKDLNKYKLRFGLSITDIGSINYKNLREDIYNINGNVTVDEIEDIDEIGDFLEDKYGTPSTRFVDKKANLPTVLHMDADWNMYKKFYLNLNGNLSLVDKSALGKTSSANTWILTPRYETKWFTFSLPVNYMEFSGTQVGAGLRLGPLFVGSSSVVTNWISKESKAADVYVGLKIPVYQPKFKDTDEDGILDHKDRCTKLAGPAENKGCPWPDKDLDKVADKDDACPTVAGPVENKGCPWGDTDKDTLLDNVDACPSVAGPVENKGCPWGDADNDTILDNVDACPSVAGPIENKGCAWPDTDGDSVLDKDDKCPNESGLVANSGCPELDADKDTVLDTEDACPTVPGPASNKGCPEVTQEVLKELKVQARAVFFVTGKAILQTADKGQTDGRLDAIKEIIKNYPNAKFSIEGHTDNVGNAKANQKLSEARAKVVMDALIAKGVNPENLTYKGFGDSKPVASNKTAAGRAENRRTEVIHVGTIYEGKL
jgi:outer membrane protein OmpA-like peptidoglycan-associated protein